MKILGIETSCDETAVCVVEAEGDLNEPRFNVLGDALYSQAKTHAEYGGVFPMLAKREHAKNLVPLLKRALQESKLIKIKENKIINEEKIKKIFAREIGLYDSLKDFASTIERPNIDLIAVTFGPGLEPALWVGINFALALGEIWDVPVMPTNHMEGHIYSPLLEKGVKIKFPALALLISGGHTELVYIEDWAKYKILGRTRDDAIGEAFDKVARLLGLPYPGGPEISRLAAEARTKKVPAPFPLSRPMINSPDFDFSFSGIKTAVLYGIKKLDSPLSEKQKQGIAKEFEDAVTETLVFKTKKAMAGQPINTLILGGGVVANVHIRESFKNLIREHNKVVLLTPQPKLSTDNAVMIATAGYINYLSGKRPAKDVEAKGNLTF